MKKRITYVLAVLMALSLTACAGSSGNGSSGSSSASGTTERRTQATAQTQAPATEAATTVQGSTTETAAAETTTTAAENPANEAATTEAADMTQAGEAAVTAQAAEAKTSAPAAAATESASEGTQAASTGATSLIVYFDYSENMGDTSGMSADAITSASLDHMTIDGITTNDLLVMKDEIQKQTGADVFSVRVNEPYDPDYDKMVGVAQDDENNNKQFTFVEELPDVTQYDTIYLGMPVWWGHLPQPMYVFLSENDFSGKTIIPFGIHLGSRFGQMVSQIKELQPNATVSDDGLTENSHTPNDEVISDVDEWLEGVREKR